MMTASVASADDAQARNRVGREARIPVGLARSRAGNATLAAMTVTPGALRLGASSGGNGRGARAEQSAGDQRAPGRRADIVRDGAGAARGQWIRQRAA
jgi:hypothetical protein